MPYVWSWLKQNESTDWRTPGYAITSPESPDPVVVTPAPGSDSAGITHDGGGDTGGGGTPPGDVTFDPTFGDEMTVIVISGYGFTGATAVRMGGVTASSYTVNSATQITATVPTGAVTGVVEVDTVVDGTLASTGSFTVTVASVGGYTSILDEQFTGAALNTSRWYTYDGSTFGAPTRIQTYQAANVVVGSGSAGSTGGTSMKLLSQETDAGSGTLPTTSGAGTRYSYTAGMVDSKTRGYYLPRYGKVEFRCKTPHGQGLWPSIWLTGKTGGATMVELDILEYFHAQVPGKNSITLHGTAGTTSGSGTFAANRYTNNVGGREFFETPTATPGWHVWQVQIRPVTDSGGLTYASNPALPSQFVEYVFHLDGVQKYRFVDTAATYYTTNGGTENSFWNVYLQGCQIDGNYVGHPRSPLGYSHWRNACLISGSPGSCATTSGGYTVRAPTFTDPGSTLEVDYFKVSKYTG